jgi:hypothetical protein
MTREEIAQEKIELECAELASLAALAKQVEKQEAVEELAKADPASGQDERISALEARVAELEALVSQLMSRPPAPVEVQVQMPERPQPERKVSFVRDSRTGELTGAYIS